MRIYPSNNNLTKDTNYEPTSVGFSFAGMVLGMCPDCGQAVVNREPHGYEMRGDFMRVVHRGCQNA